MLPDWLLNVYNNSVRISYKLSIPFNCSIIVSFYRQVQFPFINTLVQTISFTQEKRLAHCGWSGGCVHYNTISAIACLFVPHTRTNATTGVLE